MPSLLMLIGIVSVKKAMGPSISTSRPLGKRKKRYIRLYNILPTNIDPVGHLDIFKAYSNGLDLY